MAKTLDLDSLELARGAHKDRSNGLCVMEAVAWLAGETHSDRDSYNVYRSLADDERTGKMPPYVTRLQGAVAITPPPSPKPSCRCGP